MSLEQRHGVRFSAMRFKLIASVLVHLVLQLYFLATQDDHGFSYSHHHDNLLTGHRIEFQKMGDNFNPHSDSDATISNTDLLKFVLNDTNTKLSDL